MNKDYPCEIIRDLLPGYIDGILSETGEEAVVAHLEECEECRQIYREMKEAVDAEVLPEEQLVLDGFKKVHQHTRKLKITIGIVTGLLVLLIGTIFAKIFVVGEPLPTHYITENDPLYDEDTGNLIIGGTVDRMDYRVSRVIWNEDPENADIINVIVYVARSLPIGTTKKDFTITVPGMEGKTAYFACPDYDQREVYSWRKNHYEKLIEMEEEIYNYFPALNRTRDVLTYSGGIESVDGVDGILYDVPSVTGENATFWAVNDKLITDGELISRDFKIWISLGKPYQTLLYDSLKGVYTDDYSIIDQY